MGWFSLLHIFLTFRLSTSSCSKQEHLLSHQQYSDIFASNGTNIIFRNIHGVYCVHRCLVYDPSVEIISAVYVREERLCSCAPVLVSSDVFDDADGVRVYAVELPRPGWSVVTKDLL